MHPDRSARRPPDRRKVLGALAGIAVAGAAGGYAWDRFGRPGQGGRSGVTTPGAAPAGTPSAVPAGGYTFDRLTGPARTVVRGSEGTTVATFTDDARTAVLTGPARRFSEPSTTAAVVDSTAWIRLLPSPWRRGEESSAWFRQWFRKALADRSPDALAVAFEYGAAAPDRYTTSGLRYAGRAHFGPRVPGVSSPLDFHYHDEKSDFYDYLGIPWTFPDGTRAYPHKARYGDADCSGFQRLVWGYRLGYPMHGTNTPGAGLPRRAYAIAAHAPGVLLIPDTHQRPTDISMLQPGDLVFFSVNIGRPHAIDHCGMYMGLDDGGHARFYSSRSAANGPTMGDMAGVATLDGNGFYARGLRTARRL